MNEYERDLLFPFLGQLAGGPTTPGDVAANNMIQEAVRKQPNAAYLLVQRALSLEFELLAAQRRIKELEGKAPVQDQEPIVTDFLDPKNAEWGGQGNRQTPPTTSKILYDLFIEPSSPKSRDLESRIVYFIGNHSGKIWLCILVLVAVVVMFKEKL
jgi:hypothetical protein